jgi:hypothetical protein
MKEDHEGLRVHLSKLNKQLKGELKRKIELSNDTWSIVGVRAIGERFHNNFRIGFWGPSFKVHRV